MIDHSHSRPEAESAKSVRPRKTRTIALAFIGGVIILCICTVGLVVLSLKKTSNVSVRDAIIGTELREDGHISSENSVISQTAYAIYLEFYLEAPSNLQMPLQFRWYYNEQLIYSGAGSHVKGYVGAKIARDSTKLANFPTGNYHVEVWIGNTMILSEPFVVE